MRSEDEAELARANAIFLEVLQGARERARAAYDTGDRAQSRQCIEHHLTIDDREALVIADHYHCPTCQHCLKRRGGGGACSLVAA